MFIPNSHQGSRRDTATLLIGTAEEHGIDKRSIKATSRGFNIPDELAELLGVEAPEAEVVDETEEDEDVPPYDEWEYNDLKSEVATRGLDTEDHKKNTLVAALVADDVAQAESE